jgi:hypothetical protein
MSRQEDPVITALYAVRGRMFADLISMHQGDALDEINVAELRDLLEAVYLVDQLLKERGCE